MFGLIKKIFFGLLTGPVNGSYKVNHTKCVSLSNQKCMTQPTLINLHPNECSQEFHYYPFAVKLDRYVGSWNTLNDLSNKVSVPNKTEDLNLSQFNMITGIHELKTLTKDISCECKCKFDGRKCNSNQWWNSNKCLCEGKKQHIWEKDYIWNPSACSCKNGKYLASIIDVTVIMCDKIIHAHVEAKSNDKAKSNNKKTETVLTNFNKKNITCKI